VKIAGRELPQTKQWQGEHGIATVTRYKPQHGDTQAQMHGSAQTA